MKYLAFILFLFFSLQLVYSQETVDDRQLSVAVVGVDSTDQVTHYISAVGKVWELDESSFIISTDQEIYNNSAVSLGEADFGHTNWEAFFVWKWEYDGGGSKWGLGFYKITLTLPEQGPIDEYYYLDGRDSDWGSNAYNPDLYTVFLIEDEEYEIFNWPHIPANIIEIEGGEIIRVWDVKDQPPNTSELNNYWPNALVSIDDENDHPRIAWGPYPDVIHGTIIGYKIYRCAHHRVGQPGTFSLFATVDEDVYEYIDTTATVGTDVYANSYYIKCFYTNQWEDIFETSATNTVEIRLAHPQKRSAQSNSGDVTFNYVLEQNYPNPFNPATMIHFSIKTKSFATLKIYDILGKEVAVLLNNFIEAGNYSIKFNASDIPSGIYIYTLRANKYTSSRKMLLLK